MSEVKKKKKKKEFNRVDNTNKFKRKRKIYFIQEVLLALICLFVIVSIPAGYFKMAWIRHHYNEHVVMGIKLVLVVFSALMVIVIKKKCKKIEGMYNADEML